MLLSIDPGRRGCGAAVWRSGRLVAAAYVANSEREDDGPLACRAMAAAVKEWCSVVAPGVIDELMLEWPTLYGGRASKGDQGVDARDLFTLAGVDSSIATAFALAKVYSCVPHDWKGSVRKPKKVDDPYAIETRAIQRLDDDERARVVWPANKRLRWDVADGLGIGLHKLGRFDRLRVIHRTE